MLMRMLRVLLKMLGFALMLVLGLVIGIVGLAFAGEKTPADLKNDPVKMSAYVGKDGWCLDTNPENRKGYVWIRHPFDGRKLEGQLFVDMVLYLELRKKEGLEVVLAPEVGGYWMYEKKGWKGRCQ